MAPLVSSPFPGSGPDGVLGGLHGRIFALGGSDKQASGRVVAFDRVQALRWRVRQRTKPGTTRPSPGRLRPDVIGRRDDNSRRGQPFTAILCVTASSVIEGIVFDAPMDELCRASSMPSVSRGPELRRHRPSSAGRPTLQQEKGHGAAAAVPRDPSLSKPPRASGTPSPECSGSDLLQAFTQPEPCEVARRVTSAPPSV